LNSQQLTEVYNAIWQGLNNNVPANGYQTTGAKELAFWQERDTDRKIQLLIAATLIELVARLERQDAT